MDRADQMQAWLRSRADEMAGLLEELVAVDTENPPGRRGPRPRDPAGEPRQPFDQLVAPEPVCSPTGKGEVPGRRRIRPAREAPVQQPQRSQVFEEWVPSIVSEKREPQVRNLHMSLLLVTLDGSCCRAPVPQGSDHIFANPEHH
jgi:hypothetical protein